MSSLEVPRDYSAATIIEEYRRTNHAGTFATRAASHRARKTEASTSIARVVPLRTATPTELPTEAPSMAAPEAPVDPIPPATESDDLSTIVKLVAGGVFACWAVYEVVGMLPDGVFTSGK